MHRTLSRTICALAACFAAQVAAPAGAASDLSFDPAFGLGGGTYTFGAGNPSMPLERTVAVLPRIGSNAGYWVVSNIYSVGGLTSSVVLTRFSAQGTIPGGSITPSLAIGNVVAAVIAGTSTNEKIYLLGSGPFGSDPDFGVECLDVANGVFGGDCASFSPATGFTRIDFAQGGSTHSDYPSCLAYYNGSLYAAGRVNVAPNPGDSDYAAGVVKLSAGSGEVDTDWGNQSPTNGTFVRNINFQTAGFDQPTAILVAPANPTQVDFRVDVFLAGYSNVTSNDTDGWIMAIDANITTGAQLDPQWFSGSVRRVFFDLGPTKKQDSISAITQRHNGDLLFTGTASSDDNDQLILGEIKPDGNYLSSFSGGGKNHAIWTSFNQIPFAIAERPGAGSIVVASTDTYGLAGTPLVAGLAQFSPNGTVLQASTVVNLQATDTSKSGTHSGAMFVDANNRVVLAGWYVNVPGANSFSDDDDEFIARLVANDTIYANGFGGAYRD